MVQLYSGVHKAEAGQRKAARREEAEIPELSMLLASLLLLLSILGVSDGMQIRTVQAVQRLPCRMPASHKPKLTHVKMEMDAEVIIKKGRKIDKASGIPVASQGECIDTSVDPVSTVLLFGAASLLALKGFDTETNRREGDGVSRRKAITWLGLQAGAIFGLRPQVNCFAVARYGRCPSSPCCNRVLAAHEPVQRNQFQVQRRVLRGG